MAPTEKRLLTESQIKKAEKWGKKQLTKQKVEEIQQLLGIKITGAYDEDTILAVAKFQETHGLPVDGMAGLKTVKKMKEVGTYIVESEEELLAKAIENMRKLGFSNKEIEDVILVIKKDITFGRRVFLKEVLPQLIEFANCTVSVGLLERWSIPKKEVLTDGVLLGYVMGASAILQEILDRYKTTGRMEEIANSVFYDMGRVLKYLYDYRYDIGRELRRYQQLILYTREGNVILPIEKRLLSPFEYAYLSPPALRYSSSLNYWTFLPLAYSSELKSLFDPGFMGMINDIPIPERPMSLSYITAWEVFAAMSRIRDYYLHELPGPLKEIPGVLSGTARYVKEAEQQYASGTVGLEASSGPTYIKAWTDVQRLGINFYNFRLKQKEFDSLIHKLTVEIDPEKVENVLNVSLLKDEAPIGSTIIVTRRREDGLENWVYVKTTGGNFVYIGKFETKNEEVEAFFGLKYKEVILEGAGSTYMIYSPVPFTKEVLSLGASWDEETKNKVLNVLVDPKISKFLFMDNPSLIIECWELKEKEETKIYPGGGIISGEPGKNYVRLHFIAGDRQKAKITYWSEKSFLEGNYVKKIGEYQTTLETKYKFHLDFLGYLAYSSTVYVEKEGKEEWVAILQKKGIKLQTSYNPTTYYLSKFTIDINKYNLTVEFSVPGKDPKISMINVIGSAPIKDGRLSAGVFYTDQVMCGGKVIYNRRTELFGFLTDIIFSAAKWSKEGFKKLPVNVSAIDELKGIDPIGHTILAGLGIKNVAYIVCEHGRISEQYRTGVGADVYISESVFNLLKGKKRGGFKLFVVVEENTGKIFVTDRELDKETVARLGLGYYEINEKGETFRVDLTARHYWKGRVGEKLESRDYEYQLSLNKTWPSGWAYFKGSWVPSREEYEAWVGGGVTLPKNLADKIALSAAILVFTNALAEGFPEKKEVIYPAGLGGILFYLSEGWKLYEKLFKKKK